MDLSQYRLEPLRKDGEFVLYRGLPQSKAETSPRSILALSPIMEHPAPATIRKIEHEFSLKEDLDPAWAIRPIALTQQQSRTLLLFEDPNAEPLGRLAETPLELTQFLRFGIALAASLGQVHRRGLIHKDIKPSNVLANAAMDQAWLTGFGIASRLPRERRAAVPPELIAGTLAYMAPEQTGRMNRSVDSRSDLYAYGVTLYELLTGSLPFTATDPMGWVHCHIARQPLPPVERRKSVPHSVSAIIIKLLAKTPEERYQTAAGVESDLRRCLEEWDRERVVHDFGLGQHDRPESLLISEKLYGREREVGTLLASFERVVKSGKPELVLVSGYSGIGKSSVVNELHKALVPLRGLFASGKFDQLKRDIPYATVAQALQTLVRQLLGKPEAELSRWRDNLRQALDPNGALVTDLIPELKLIIGGQLAVPDVAPEAERVRFQMAIRALIGVFASAEHSLVLFLDDLQWLDAATLDLLESILVESQLRHLLLVGAYRDNEVDEAHSLMRKLSALRRSGAVVQEVVLGPLTNEDFTQWFAAAFQAEAEHARPLAKLVHEKTAGNPFFANQLLQELVEDRLVAFDSGHAGWRWDLEPIQTRDYTENVVDLMVGKLSRLPLTTQEALNALACLGNAADTSTLAVIHGTSEEQIHAHLWDALRLELIVRSDDSYRFVHDRVQEAAYSLVPEDQRAAQHLRIGRLLASQITPDKREEGVFEIVGHFNRAAALLMSQEEREEVAALNLMAGKRAKKAAAYVSALNYLTAGAALVAGEEWRRHDLVFELEFHRSECEFLTGEVTSAEERLTLLSSRASSITARAAVVCLQTDVYYALQRIDRGLSEAVEFLSQAGFPIPLGPTESEARAAFDSICSRLDGVGIDELAALPLMTDPASRAILDVIAKIATSAATIAGRTFEMLITCSAIALTLERGAHDASCWAFTVLGYLAAWKYGDFEVSFRFGHLGYELIERTGLRRFEGFVCLTFSTLLLPWAKHVANCRPVIRRTFEVAHNTGDRIWAVQSRNILLSNLLMAGDSLVEVEGEAEASLAFCRAASFPDYTNTVSAQLALIRNLRGLTRQFGLLDDDRFEERRIENHYESEPHLLGIEYWYWVRKLQARFLAGNYVAALEASRRAQDLLEYSAGMLERAEHELYSGLTHAALFESLSSDHGQQHLEAMVAHHRQLEIWARNCPENFANRASLVAAEIARIEARDSDAAQLYEHAISSARESGFVHNEALALEIAARFYTARGFDRIAKTYLRDARYGYLRWGADGKVRQLDQLYPYLKSEEGTAVSTGVIAAPLEQLDLSTVLKVSRAVQGETDLEKLIATVMRLGLEHAGAARGLLILPHGDGYQIKAEATSSNESVTVDLRQTRIGIDDLPQSVLQYVLRTRESVLLQDASVTSEFAGDEYLRRHQARSVLCIPLLKQTRLVGILYLENNLTSGAFTPARIALLEVLASDAATSLENAVLYRDLQERERESRMIVDSIPGLVATLTPDGEVEAVSEQVLAYCGRTLEELKEWGMSDTVHPDDRLLAIEIVSGSMKSGDPYEIVERIRRSDGVYRSFQVRGLPLRDSNGNVVRWYVLLTDIDDLKRAEAALQSNELSLSLIINTIPTHIYVLNIEGSVRYVNQAVIDYTDLTLENVQQEDYRDRVIHPEDFKRVRAGRSASLRLAAPFSTEQRVLGKDGQYRWFLVRYKPLLDEQGRIVRWYVAAFDIEDRKRAESELGALKDQLYKENLVLRDEVDRASMFEEIVGTSRALQPVLTRIAKVGPTDSTALITGETGTGKELVARAIHRRSRRSAHPFVSVNCAAVPRELIASELFGHEKGAFTGAMQRRLGRFELAAQGTIFLDEVGELPAETQVALLRVLQEREFERVGGTATIRADVRVIAATNRDLEAEIAAGRFRSDLFYRLNVFPLEVPPLRDRKEDIPLLVEYFLDRYARKAGKSFKTISNKSLQLLQSYPWPGNIRELQNVIERSVIVNESTTFSVDESWLSRQAQTAEPRNARQLSRPLAGEEKEMIEAALRECGGRVSGPSGAASKLGIPGSTLESKIKSLQINKNRFKS